MRGIAILAGAIAAMALVTVALAQPRGRGRPRPRPSTTSDGGVDNPYGDEGPTLGGSNPTPASPQGAIDAGAAPPSPPPSTNLPVARPTASSGDGGVKPSPLNPAPNELPPPPGTTPAATGSVDYDKLLGDVAALRARVAAVSDNLFVSRIAIGVQTDGSAKISRLSVSLDDGIVYTAPPGFRAEDATTIYDHAVAPGRHAVTVDIERKDEHDDTFRTSQRSRLIVDVPKDDRLTVAVRVGDDSNMGAAFPGDRSGQYDLRVRMKASAAPVKR